MEYETIFCRVAGIIMEFDYFIYSVNTSNSCSCDSDLWNNKSKWRKNVIKLIWMDSLSEHSGRTHTHKRARIQRTPMNMFAFNHQILSICVNNNDGDSTTNGWPTTDLRVDNLKKKEELAKQICIIVKTGNIMNSSRSQRTSSNSKLSIKRYSRMLSAESRRFD